MFEAVLSSTTVKAVVSGTPLVAEVSAATKLTVVVPIQPIESVSQQTKITAEVANNVTITAANFLTNEW